MLAREDANGRVGHVDGPVLLPCCVVGGHLLLDKGLDQFEQDVQGVLGIERRDGGALAQDPFVCEQATASRVLATGHHGRGAARDVEVNREEIYARKLLDAGKRCPSISPPEWLRRANLSVSCRAAA